MSALMHLMSREELRDRIRELEAQLAKANGRIHEMRYDSIALKNAESERDEAVEVVRRFASKGFTSAEDFLARIGKK